MIWTYLSDATRSSKISRVVNTTNSKHPRIFVTLIQAYLTKTVIKRKRKEQNYKQIAYRAWGFISWLFDVTVISKLIQQKNIDHFGVH